MGEEGRRGGGRSRTSRNIREDKVVLVARARAVRPVLEQGCAPTQDLRLRRSRPRPHTRVEARGGRPEKRKGRRRWPQERRSLETRARDAAAPEQEEEEGSNRMQVLMRRAWG